MFFTLGEHFTSYEKNVTKYIDDLMMYLYELQQSLNAEVSEKTLAHSNLIVQSTALEKSISEIKELKFEIEKLQDENKSLKQEIKTHKLTGKKRVLKDTGDKYDDSIRASISEQDRAIERVYSELTIVCRNRPEKMQTVIQKLAMMVVNEGANKDTTTNGKIEETDERGGGLGDYDDDDYLHHSSSTIITNNKRRSSSSSSPSSSISSLSSSSAEDTSKSAFLLHDGHDEENNESSGNKKIMTKNMNQQSTDTTITSLLFISMTRFIEFAWKNINYLEVKQQLINTLALIAGFGYISAKELFKIINRNTQSKLFRMVTKRAAALKQMMIKLNDDTSIIGNKLVVIVDDNVELPTTTSSSTTTYCWQQLQQ